MEKIILVIYINIIDMSLNERDQMLYEINKTIHDIEKHDNSIKHYLLPGEYKENKIECINPKLVSEEEYIKAKESLEKIQEILNNIEKQ